MQSDESLGSLSEADISLGVILRILDALNWSTYNRREVSPEYSVENRWVDYALLIGDTPQVFIEVKKGGEPLERHQEQLLDYAFRQGVKVAILTNGTTWWFYLPLRAVSWEQRKVATVELDTQVKEEIAQKLVELLGKENVRSGQAVRNAEVLYEKRQMAAILPEAWHQLVSEPDDFLVDLLAEKAKELCGHEPDENEVEKFLLAHLQDIRITKSPDPISPKPKPQKDTKRKAFTVTKPTAFTFNGHREEVSSWKEMILKLCKILYADHADFEQRVLEIKGSRGRRFFSRNADDVQEGLEINGIGIYVDTFLDAEWAKRFAEKIITEFGYGKGSLSFEVRQ